MTPPMPSVIPFLIPLRSGRAGSWGFENVMCDLRNCIFTCLKHGFLNGGRSAGTVEGGQTNPCLECDEKMCGREFIKCAGANRRRSGIVSDIERDDDKELCKIADFING